MKILVRYVYCLLYQRQTQVDQAHACKHEIWYSIGHVGWSKYVPFRLNSYRLSHQLSFDSNYNEIEANFRMCREVVGLAKSKIFFQEPPSWYLQQKCRLLAMICSLGLFRFSFGLTIHFCGASWSSWLRGCYIPWLETLNMGLRMGCFQSWRTSVHFRVQFLTFCGGLM